MANETPETLEPADEACCSRCGGPMRQYRLTPKLGGLPELVTYMCIVCGDVVTEMDE